MMLDSHIQIVIIIHIPSTFDQAFNDQQTLFLIWSANQAPD